MAPIPAQATTIDQATALVAAALRRLDIFRDHDHRHHHRGEITHVRRGVRMSEGKSHGKWV
jgi:hypothetical protein